MDYDSLSQPARPILISLGEEPGLDTARAIGTDSFGIEQFEPQESRRVRGVGGARDRR
jgi:hypothetical protein